MDEKTAKRLAKEYPYFWRENLAELADGWVKPLVDLFESLYRLHSVDATSDRAIIAVDLRIEMNSGRAMAYASPTMSPRWWTDGRRKALIDAMSEFYGSCQETCQLCGEPGVYNLGPRGARQEGVYCNRHMPGASR